MNLPNARCSLCGCEGMHACRGPITCSRCGARFRFADGHICRFGLRNIHMPLIHIPLADESAIRLAMAERELEKRALHHAAEIVKRGHVCGGRCVECQIIVDADEALREDEG